MERLRLEICIHRLLKCDGLGPREDLLQSRTDGASIRRCCAGAMGSMSDTFNRVAKWSFQVLAICPCRATASLFGNPKIRVQELGDLAFRDLQPLDVILFLQTLPWSRKLHISL